MSGLALRDYQTEAVGAVESALAGGMRRPAVVLPTGAGKTVVFGEIVRRRHRERDAGRTVVLVHREELARQAVAKLQAAAPHLRTGVVKADRDEVGAPVVVASVQTLRNEARRRRLRGVGLIIVDECHHATASSYRTVLDHYGALGQGPAVAVGFTATMSRGDGVGLGEIWEDIVYTRDIRYMITRGFLVPPRGIRVRVEDLDLSKVRRTAGDYSEGQLGEALAASLAPERIVEAYREHAKDRPTLLFVPTVAFAELMVERLSAEGVAAVCVHGSMPAAERAAALAGFIAGSVSVLVNCMVLTEGTDLPLASCVIIARPTCHAGLYVQMVGRVLRPYPGKADALVLDVVGASVRHRLAGLVDLIGERDSEPGEGVEPVERLAGLALDEREQMWADGPIVAEEVDLFHGSRSAWLRTRGGVWFIPTDRRYIALIPGMAPDLWDVVSIDRRRVGESDWVIRGVGDLGYAMAHGEACVTHEEERYAMKQVAWRKRPATQKQRALAQQYGVIVAENARSGEASNAITVAEASWRIDPRVPVQPWVVK